jgi:hypothetical protein
MATSSSKKTRTADDVKRVLVADVPKQKLGVLPGFKTGSSSVGECGIGIHPPVGLFEASLQTLETRIQDSHLAVTSLLNTLQPFLQSHVFSDDAGAVKADADPERTTVGSSLSPALSAMYSNLNELDRLIARLEYLRQMVVL